MQSNVTGEDMGYDNVKTLKSLQQDIKDSKTLEGNGYGRKKCCVKMWRDATEVQYSHNPQELNMFAGCRDC